MWKFWSFDWYPAGYVLFDKLTEATTLARLSSPHIATQTGAVLTCFHPQLENHTLLPANLNLLCLKDSNQV